MMITRVLLRLRARLKFGKKKLVLQSGAYVSRRTVFEGYNKIGKNSKFKGRMGFASIIGNDCELEASIGRYCSVGNNVKVIKYTHPSRKYVSTHPAFYSTKKQAGFSYVSEQLFNEILYVDSEERIPVEIGNDVWIGSNVNIMGGVRIGDGAIIGAGALVLKDVKPYEIVAGVPAKLIRKRFSEEEIALLLEVKWWNKDFDWLKKNANIFDDIKKFAAFFKN